MSRRASIEQLAEPLSGAALSRSRTLPVLEPLAPLLPDGGLVRGRAVACGGVAAMSLAVSLTVAATASGSWLAVVDIPSFGLEAAEEFGVPLERVVSVELGGGATGERWAELVTATLDGFEVIITCVPRGLNAALARKVHARLKARDAVLISVGRPGSRGTAQPHGSLLVDVDLRATDQRWEGVAAGWGHLCGRRVSVSSSGRRVPRPRQLSLWLPGPDGRVDLIEEGEVIPFTGQQVG